MDDSFTNDMIAGAEDEMEFQHFVAEDASGMAVDGGALDIEALIGHDRVSAGIAAAEPATAGINAGSAAMAHGNAGSLPVAPKSAFTGAISAAVL